MLTKLLQFRGEADYGGVAATALTRLVKLALRRGVR